MKVNIKGVWHDANKTPIQIKLNKTDKKNISNMEKETFNYVCFPNKMKWDDVKEILKIK